LFLHRNQQQQQQNFPSETEHFCRSSKQQSNYLKTSLKVGLGLQLKIKTGKYTVLFRTLKRPWQIMAKYTFYTLKFKL
jgi:hypothetical protein